MTFQKLFAASSIMPQCATKNTALDSDSRDTILQNGWGNLLTMDVR